MARAGSKKERAPREQLVTEIPDFSRTQLTALHEAAHVVVAHALGRRPVYASIEPKFLPPGHPLNQGSQARRQLGLTYSEPQLGEQINSQQAAGLPLTAEQTDWLLCEAVILAAGVVGENGSLESSEYDADLGLVAYIAYLLRRTE